MHPELAEALRKRGVSQLYTHQQEAFAALEAGQNVCVVTPTASGKTLCYNLPVLNQVLRNRERLIISVDYRVKSHQGEPFRICSPYGRQNTRLLKKKSTESWVLFRKSE